jgi:hypothetical protein
MDFVIFNISRRVFEFYPHKFLKLKIPHFYFEKIVKEKILKKSSEVKKSDAQVGRVNTFHILQNIRKGPSNFKLCMKRPLRFSNF